MEFCGLVLLFCLVSQINCGYHYCGQNDFEQSFSLRSDIDQTEQVRGYLNDQPDRLRATGPLNCKWEFIIAGMQPGRLVQLALKAVMLTDSPVGLECGETGMSYSMSEPLCAGSNTAFSWCSAATAPVTIMTIPVFSSKSLLTVSYRRAASDNRTGIQELSVSVAKPGYCGRDWLAFKGRCYFISSKPLTLKQTDEAWQTFRGPRLAVFENVAEIQAFLLANKKRANESPYRPALDLSLPVRVGLVRTCRPGDGESGWLSFAYWKTNACGGFSEGSFNDSSPGLFNSSTGNNRDLCVTLKAVFSGKEPVLAPSNCDEAALSLLAFEESPTLGSSEACPADNCTAVNATVSSLLSGCGAAEQWQTSRSLTVVFMLATLVLVVITSIIFSIVLICRRVRNSTNQGDNNAEREREEKLSLSAAET